MKTRPPPTRQRWSRAPDVPVSDTLSPREALYTPGRRTVLQLLRRQNHPIGAYEVLFLYQKERGCSASPTTIYRALDFLEEEGLVVRLASTQTYIARRSGIEARPVVLFICSACGATTEQPQRQVARTLRSMAEAIGFVPRSPTLEVAGVCQQCPIDAKAGRNSRVKKARRERPSLP